MKAYSKDLTKKIVDAVEQRGMGQSEATRLFDISLSSVKRYLRKSRKGRSLSAWQDPR
jgi:transposase